LVLRYEAARFVQQRRGAAARKEATTVQARDFMQPHVITAQELATADQVAAHMIVGRISGFPITDSEQSLVGIVTELDLIRALRAGRDLETTLADEIMTCEVITVDAADSIERVMEILDSERIIRVPVISDGELVGIISRGDVLRAALSNRESRVL
jgi:CBS domain-containing protein